MEIEKLNTPQSQELYLDYSEKYKTFHNNFYEKSSLKNENEQKEVKPFWVVSDKKFIGAAFYKQNYSIPKKLEVEGVFYEMNHFIRPSEWENNYELKVIEELLRKIYWLNSNFKDVYGKNKIYGNYLGLVNLV